MKKIKSVDQPVVIGISDEGGNPLAGIPVWLGFRVSNTDLKGEALFLGLESGDYQLAIDAADYSPVREEVRIDHKNDNLKFVLHGYKTGGIKGNVRLIGTDYSLTDSQVRITACRPDETGAVEFSFWTDWDGNYSAGSIPAGEYLYIANAPHCEHAEGKLRIEKDSVLELDIGLKHIPEPARIKVNIETSDGKKVKKSMVRLLEGMGAVVVAEKTGGENCAFTDIDLAPFNMIQNKEKPFLNRSFVVSADIEGYHTGYAAGSLRSDKECEVKVLCIRKNEGEVVIKGADIPAPAVIPLDEALKVQIPVDSTERLFKVVLPHPGNVNVKAGPNPFTTHMRILDKELKVLSDKWNYAQQTVEATIQSLSGELYIGVRGDINAAGEVFSLLAVNYMPIIDPYKPNSTFDSALPVEFGEILRPFIFPQKDCSYFMAEVKRPGIMRVRLTGCPINARIRILNPEAGEIVNTWNYSNQTIDSSIQVHKPGFYRIELAGTDGSGFTLSPATLWIDFTGSESRLGDFLPDLPEPKRIQLGKRFGGTIFPGGKYNLFSFYADRTGFVKVRFLLPGCNSRLRLLNPEGKEIHSSWNYSNQALNPDIAIQDIGEHLIEISGTDGSNYALGSFFTGVYFYPNDEYEGSKGNDLPDMTSDIFIGQEVKGIIGKPGDADCYRFYVDQPDLLMHCTDTFPVNLRFIVTDPFGKEIFNSWNYSGQNLDREYHVSSRGYHTLKIAGTNPNDYSSASYGFRIEHNRVKPESVQSRNRIMLGMDKGIKLDALMPGSVKSLVLPVTAPMTVVIGAKIPVNSYLTVTGADGRELFNSWNYAGQPLKAQLKLDVPGTLIIAVCGTNPSDWSKNNYFIYATSGDIPPEPVLTLERIYEDNRRVSFNVSGIPSENNEITKYEMDFEGDGRFKKVEPGIVEHVYKKGSMYCPMLKVTDKRGAVGTENMFLDLIDVSLVNISCRVDFPHNGDVISMPQNIFAQASAGPGKPVHGMRLFLDDRLVAKSNMPYIEAGLEWKALSAGEHTIKAEAFTKDGSVTEDSAIFKISDVFGLWPDNGQIITGSRVVITWYSPVAYESQVEYRRTGEEKWNKTVGSKGREHGIVLEGLDTGIMYEFKAGDGSTWSEIRSFTLEKGLSFEQPKYSAVIERDYGQVIPVAVRNNSDHPMEVVLVCIQPEDGELLVGFVGEGSEDMPVHLEPGGIRQYRLSLSAQDCIHELHLFQVRIVSKDGFKDQAEVEARVKIPVVDLLWEEVETNPNTLGIKLRLKNNGDGLTDLTVRAFPEGAFRLRPFVEHACLPAGQSMELWADPVLFEGFKSIKGEVRIETFGRTFSHKLDCTAPDGMQVYRVTVDPAFSQSASTWVCTNRPNVAIGGLYAGFASESQIGLAGLGMNFFSKLRLLLNKFSIPMAVIYKVVSLIKNLYYLPELPSGALYLSPDDIVKIGQELAKKPEFAKLKTDVEKAQFILDMMDEIKGKYSLGVNRMDLRRFGILVTRYGPDFTIGLIDLIKDYAVPNLFSQNRTKSIGIYLDNAKIYINGIDKDDLLSLRFFGVGNCAEWTYLYAKILKGAGVKDITVIYADNSESNTPSLGHGGTDTALYILDGNRRVVFDVYRKFYFPDTNTNPVPGQFSYRYGNDLETWVRSTGKKIVKTMDGTTIYK